LVLGDKGAGGALGPGERAIERIKGQAPVDVIMRRDQFGIALF
jgi:hypothetical protein